MTTLAAITALVSMYVEASRMGEVLEALSKLDNIEEFSEVTGDFDILSVVSCDDIEEFHNVLKYKIQKIPGVKNTVSSIVLGTFKGSRVVYGSPQATLVPSSSEPDLLGEPSSIE